MTDSPRASAATPAMRPNERGTRIRVPRSFGRIAGVAALALGEDRKSTRLNSSHSQISYAVFCLKKKKKSHAQFRKDHLLSRATDEYHAPAAELTHKQKSIQPIHNLIKHAQARYPLNQYLDHHRAAYNT